MSLHFGPVSFAIAFCCAYVLFFWTDTALFLYYPQIGEFAWGWQRRTGAGPGMVWFGLMANTGIAAAVLAFALPERLLDRLFRNYLWLFPCAAMLICVYLLRPFFLVG